MGALGHYLEHAGIPTAGFSLIRPHSEKIRPPRALWVPFELGRPLGVPNDAAFQTSVLRALLALLAEKSGPVLHDYPEDAPGTETASDDSAGWACPVSFDRAPAEETLGQAIHREIRQLHPWHDLARERRGRSTFGEAGLTIEQAADFLLAWTGEARPDSPRAQITSPELLKLAAEDLKAFYFEAAAAQPAGFTGARAAAWFWGETSAAQLFLALRTICMAAPEPEVQRMGQNNLVPRDQWSRFGIDDRWWR